MQTYRRITPGRLTGNVQAARIEAITQSQFDLDTVYLFLEGGPLPHAVSARWAAMSAPRIGGYLLRYADLLEVYCAAEAFEANYQPLDTPSAPGEPAGCGPADDVEPPVPEGMAARLERTIQAYDQLLSELNNMASSPAFSIDARYAVQQLLNRHAAHGGANPNKGCDSGKGPAPTGERSGAIIMAAARATEPSLAEKRRLEALRLAAGVCRCDHGDTSRMLQAADEFLQFLKGEGPSTPD